MGRPKKVGGPSFTVTADPTGAASNGDGEAPDPQTVDAMSGAADEGQKAPRARITRWNENMRQYAVLDHVSAEAVDEQWIKDEYGGGKYRVYYWGTKKDKTYGYLEGAGKEFVIDDSIPFKGALKYRAATAPVQNPDGTPAGDGKASLLDMGMLQIFKSMQDNSALMMSQSRDNSAALAAMLERLAAPRDSGMKEMLIALTPLIAPLIAGVMNREDPVELATAIAQLAKPAQNGLGNLHDLIELKDTLAMLSGNGEDEGGSIWRIVEKTLPGLVDILKQESAKTGKPMIQLARQPAPARIGAPPTAPSSAATSPSPASASSAGTPSSSPVPDAIQDEWTGLEPHMQTLAGFAQQNRDPYGVMQTIKTLAPAQMLAAVRELVARDDALDVLLNRFPVLQPYRAWTDQLLDEFFADFFPDQVEDDTPPEPEPDGISS